jgi:hypothetical protein
MGDDDIAHAADLFRRKGEAQAAAVNGNSLVDQETGQALFLRFSPGPAWQKSDSHEFSLLHQWPVVSVFQTCNLKFQILLSDH